MFYVYAWRMDTPPPSHAAFPGSEGLQPSSSLSSPAAAAAVTAASATGAALFLAHSHAEAGVLLSVDHETGDEEDDGEGKEDVEGLRVKEETGNKGKGKRKRVEATEEGLT
jgi:hypothetical protein